MRGTVISSALAPRRMCVVLVWLLQRGSGTARAGGAAVAAAGGLEVGRRRPSSAGVATVVGVSFVPSRPRCCWLWLLLWRRCDRRRSARKATLAWAIPVSSRNRSARAQPQRVPLLARSRIEAAAERAHCAGTPARHETAHGLVAEWRHSRWSSRANCSARAHPRSGCGVLLLNTRSQVQFPPGRGGRISTGMKKKKKYRSITHTHSTAALNPLN